LGSYPKYSRGDYKVNEALGERDQLKVCYEAGPTGYPIYRLLLSLSIECSVVAPSLIPKKPGERVKTDRRDAIRLSQLFRAGELTSIYVPTEDDEALRDLVRAREDSKEDHLRARHRLTKFLLRYDLNPPADTRKWTQRYRDWLDVLKFSRAALSKVFEEYLHHLDEIEERVKRLEAEIHIQATESVNCTFDSSTANLAWCSRAYSNELSCGNRFVYSVWWSSTNNGLYWVSAKRTFKWRNTSSGKDHKNGKYPCAPFIN